MAEASVRLGGTTPHSLHFQGEPSVDETASLVSEARRAKAKQHRAKRGQGWPRRASGWAALGSPTPQFAPRRVPLHEPYQRRHVWIGLGRSKTVRIPFPGGGTPVASAALALEDGTVYVGESFGATGTVSGEVCFNTSMTGYQEILTDPSYRGQILTMTAAEIGNYGINAEDVESGRLQMAGFVVRSASRIASNFTSTGTLHDYLAAAGVVGIQGIDTRALVRKLRSQGVMTGVLSSEIHDHKQLVAMASSAESLVGRDMVREVMPEAARDWSDKLDAWSEPLPQPSIGGELPPAAAEKPLKHVVALDYGMKWNIARHLASRNCRVTVLPGSASADEVLALSPDGVFLSNGPGDPEPLTYAVETVRGLVGKLPIFGICLGHQLLAQACGAKTFKLKFGHRGGNQPVMDLSTGTVEITSQNHGFAVEEESLPADLEVTHRNLNDGTIEGLRHRTLPAASVQYHPEAAAGPHDSAYLFDRFRAMLDAV
jgi:carbamoyl-phosphate synthase small subunit